MRSPSGSETYFAHNYKAPARRIAVLARELARELADLEPENLSPTELRALMNGMTGTTAALTCLFDRLRNEAVLLSDSPTHDPPPRRVVLEQAAAAADDLHVSAETLARSW